MASKFSNWLTECMNDRGWNQATLARVSGLTPTAISDLVNDRRNPGKDSCIAIAKALKLPREFVFQVAGILEGVDSDDDPRIKKIEYLYNSLQDEGNKERAIQFMEFLSGLEDKGDQKGKKPKR